MRLSTAPGALSLLLATYGAVCCAEPANSCTTNAMGLLISSTQMLTDCPLTFLSLLRWPARQAFQAHCVHCGLLPLCWPARNSSASFLLPFVDCTHTCLLSSHSPTSVHPCILLAPNHGRSPTITKSSYLGAWRCCCLKAPAPLAVLALLQLMQGRRERQGKVCVQCSVGWLGNRVENRKQVTGNIVANRVGGCAEPLHQGGGTNACWAVLIVARAAASRQPHWP